MTSKRLHVMFAGVVVAEMVAVGSSTIAADKPDANSFSAIRL